MPDKINKDGTNVTIIGNSPVLNIIKDKGKKVALTDSSAFLLGESGTGKSLFAEFIHQNGPRRHKPFITINCAALLESMPEDELFGHVKGAFTGAIDSRAGKFEAANGGAIFLDEIGDLSLAIQGKILRLVQEKKLERLGSNKTIQVDVRIIAATNKNIRQMVADGKFRQDLFYRLNILTIEIPPLRKRLEDIPELAEYILTQNTKQNKRFHPKTLQALKQHSYAENNIRELEGIIIKAITDSEDDPCIMPEHLEIPQTEILPEKQPDYLPGETDLNIAQNIAPQIKVLVQKAMAKHHGLKNKAAEELRISLFQLNNLLKNPGISVQAILNHVKPAEKLGNPPIQPPTSINCGLLDNLDAKSREIVDLAAKEGKVTKKWFRIGVKFPAVPPYGCFPV